MHRIYLTALLLTVLFLPKYGVGIDYNYTDSLELIVSTSDDVDQLSEVHLRLARAYQKDSLRKSEHHYISHVKYASKIDEMSHLYALCKLEAFYFFGKHDKKYKSTHSSIYDLIADSDYLKIHYYSEEGSLKSRVGDMLGAIKSYSTALDLVPDDSLSLIGEINNRLGVSKKNVGNHQAALKHYLKAQDAYNKLGNQRGLAGVYTNIGVIYKHQKDFTKAEYYYKLAMTFAKQTKNQNAIANLHANTGVLYKIEGKYDQALNEYMKAYELHMKIGNTKNAANVMHNVGNCMNVMGEYRNAISQLKRTLIMKESLGSYFSSASSYDALSESYLGLEMLDSALYFSKIGLDLAQKSGSADLLLDIYDTQYEIYLGLNDIENFRSAWNEYKTIYDTLFSSEKTRMIYQIQAQFEMERDEELRENERQVQLSKEREEELKDEVNTGIQSRERIIKIAEIAGVILLLLLVFTLYSRNRSVRRSQAILAKTNQELKETLLSKEEKEVLLKEIHHRVKNNMQIIMSLLRLQSANITDEYIQSLYTESQNRIRSMALVHEELYQTRNFSAVNVKQYLEKLITNLIQNYSLDTKVDVEYDIEVQKMNIDTLIPLGLILNEIISNSLKHAFKELERGKVVVKIKRLDDNSIVLFASDNGPGISTSDRNKETLGQELISSLVEQLDGTIEINNNEGAEYTVIFKEQGK